MHLARAVGNNLLGNDMAGMRNKEARATSGNRIIKLVEECSGSVQAADNGRGN